MLRKLMTFNLLTPLHYFQVSSLVFAPNYKELVSGHGFAHDKIFIWKYPSLAKVAELEGLFHHLKRCSL